MKDWGLDLFYSRTAVMDLDDSNSSPTASHQSDFAFAFNFNDSNFSDRLLRIEIIANSPDARSESDGCCGLADWAGRLCDLRRRDIAEKRHASDVSNCPEEQVYDCQQPDVEDGIGDGDNDEVPLKMIEDSPSEEAALMELLNFMYSNTLSINAPPALLDVLMAADKFEVVSCMKYCCHRLRNLPMTPESALVYLDLPSSIPHG